MSDAAPDIHAVTRELLPWHVNGTLGDRERLAVDKHLRECLPCRAHAREERRLAAAVASQDDLPVKPVHGMADLLARIDQPGLQDRWPMTAAVPIGLAATLLLTVGAFVFTSPDQRESRESGEFSTLTSGFDVAPNRIDFIFAAGVSAGEIEAIIASVNGRLIDGPSGLGRYTAEVPTDDVAELTEIIDQFTADPRILFAGRNFSGIGDPTPSSP